MELCIYVCIYVCICTVCTDEMKFSSPGRIGCSSRWSAQARWRHPCSLGGESGTLRRRRPTQAIRAWTPAERWCLWWIQIWLHIYILYTFYIHLYIYTFIHIYVYISTYIHIYIIYTYVYTLYIHIQYIHYIYIYIHYITLYIHIYTLYIHIYTYMHLLHTVHCDQSMTSTFYRIVHTYTTVYKYINTSYIHTYIYKHKYGTYSILWWSSHQRRTGHRPYRVRSRWPTRTGPPDLVPQWPPQTPWWPETWERRQCSWSHPESIRLIKSENNINTTTTTTTTTTTKLTP